MPTLRRGGRRQSRRPAGSARHPAHSESPYGSRRLVVEYDGVTTAAYVHDADVRDRRGLARQPPAGPGRRRPGAGRAGQAPVMPAGHTKHPRRQAAAGPAHPARAVVRGGRRGGPAWRAARCSRSFPAGPTCPAGCPATAGTCIGQTPFALVPGRRHGGTGPAGGPGHGVLALAGQRGCVGRLPEGGPGAPARPARPGRPVLGCQRRQAAVGRGVRTAADPQPAVTRCCPRSA